MWYDNMNRMFEQFSSGYYLGRLYVQAHDGPRAVLRESHHRRVRKQLYGSISHSEGPQTESPDRTERDEQLLVMRLQQQHFVVDGDDDVPEQTLAVPREWLADRPDPLEPREVFLAKADRAQQLLQFAVGPQRHSVDSSGTDDSSDSGAPVNLFTPQALGDASGPAWRQ